MADTIEVTNYLRDRFGEDKVYLLGQSWGTLLGVLAVQQQPDCSRRSSVPARWSAPWRPTSIMYQDTLDWAEGTGNTDLVATLTEIGPPPYRTCSTTNPCCPPCQGLPLRPHRNAEGPGEMGEGIFVGEYSLMDKVHNFGGFLDTFSVLYPQLQGIDLRAT